MAENSQHSDHSDHESGPEIENGLCDVEDSVLGGSDCGEEVPEQRTEDDVYASASVSRTSDSIIDDSHRPSIASSGLTSCNEYPSFSVSEVTEPSVVDDRLTDSRFTGIFEFGVIISKESSSIASSRNSSFDQSGKPKSKFSKSKILAATRVLFKGNSAKVQSQTNQNNLEPKDAPKTHLPIFKSVKTLCDAYSKKRNPRKVSVQGTLYSEHMRLRCLDSSATIEEGVEIVDIPLKYISLRDVGSGVYVFNDPLFNSDDNETKTISTLDFEDSEYPGMFHMVNCLELLDRKTRKKYIVGSKNDEEKGKWLKEIQNAVANYFSSELPDLVSMNSSWKHTCLRGTLYSAALEGNMEQFERIMAWLDREPECQTPISDRQRLESRHSIFPSGAEDIDENGANALHYAALAGHSKIVESFISLKANLVHALDNRLMTPLHYAASGARDDLTAAALIRAGNANPSAQDIRKRTPAFLSCFQAFAEIRNQNADEAEQTRIRSALCKFLKTISFYDADFEQPSINGTTCMSLTIDEEEHQVFSTLLELNLSLETPCESSSSLTPLAYLCKQAHPNLFLLSKLLSHGANPNCRDREFNTPLHILAENFESKTLHAVERVDGKGQSCMTEFQRQAAEALILNGANVDLVNSKGVSSSLLLVNQGFSMKKPLEIWRSRAEPTCMETMVKYHLFRIPFALELNSPRWETDDARGECILCKVGFSLLLRKHHCRSCGRLCCANCTSKRFTHRIVQSNGIESTMKVKVCDSCFNNLSRTMIIATDRLSLFVDTGTREKNAEIETKERVASTLQKNRAVDGENLTSRIKQTLADAQSALLERGERLESIMGKTDEFSEQASGFASMAEKLRKTEERRSKWFGGF